MHFALAREIQLRTLSDDRLARMAAEGDAQAFAAIYERYSKALYRYCRSILADPHDARDALQSAMVKALKGIGGQTEGGALKAWLFRIAHNECISLARRNRPSVELTERGEPLAQSAYGEAADRARLEQLLQDMLVLPERQRRALVMRELCGFDYGAIGAALASSPDAAKQAVHEGRRALTEDAAGRSAACETIRAAIAAGDGRVRRARRIQAHLRGCAACSEFLAKLRAATAAPASSSL
ncbi:MAG: RNA polymerase sigma factor [Thermoleophilaceae bacterium]